MKKATTRFLITCAVLALAGALLLIPANWLSTVLFVSAPYFGVALMGVWILPSVVALRLLKVPGAGMLVALMAGLILVPFSGYGFVSILTNLWFAFFTEIAFLLVFYRSWNQGLHYIGALIGGVAYPFFGGAAYNLWDTPIGLQITFFAICIVSSLLGTWLGILIADRLKQTGVAKSSRPRAKS